MITFEMTACRGADGRIWLPEVVADLADLEDEEVLGRERVVELVRVDLEQDRGHSTGYSDTV